MLWKAWITWGTHPRRVADGLTIERFWLSHLRRWMFFPCGVPALAHGANLWRTSGAGKVPSTVSEGLSLLPANHYSMDWMPESMERCVTLAPLMT